MKYRKADALKYARDLKQAALNVVSSLVCAGWSKTWDGLLVSDTQKREYLEQALAWSKVLVGRALVAHRFTELYVKQELKKLDEKEASDA